MLLVIDVGNTNTVLGVFARAPHAPGEDATSEAARYERLVAHWRVGSHLTRTVDEYGVIFRNLFSMESLEVSAVRGIVISSVVPPLDSVLREVCERYFNTRPLFIGPGVKTGMPVLYDNPAEVGADRIVFDTPERDASRTWRYADIANVSHSGLFDLSLNTQLGTEVRFALKEPLTEERFHALWLRLEEVNGLTPYQSRLGQHKEH